MSKPEIEKKFPPIVYLLIGGSGFMVLAKSMSMPFLAIYLYRTLSMDAASIGLLIGAGALVGSFFGFVGGWLSDIFSRKQILLISLLLSSIGFTGFGVATTSVHFLIFNLLINLAGSCYGPVSKATMSDNLDGPDRLRAFSLRYLAVNVGYAIGPVLGAYLGLLEGGSAFFVASFAYLIFLVILWKYYEKGSSDSALEGKGVIQPSNSVDLGVLFSDKRLLMFTFGSMLALAVHGDMSVAFSQYLDMNFDKGIQMFAWLMSVNAITVVLCQPVLIRLSERYPLIHSVVAGSILLAVGAVLFGYALTMQMFVIGMVIFTIGEVLIVPAEYALLDRITPEKMRGSYYGAHSLFNIGNLVGPWAGGWILMQYSGMHLFYAMSICAIASMFVFIFGTTLRAEKAIEYPDTSQTGGTQP